MSMMYTLVYKLLLWSLKAVGWLSLLVCRLVSRAYQCLRSSTTHQLCPPGQTFLYPLPRTSEQHRDQNVSSNWLSSKSLHPRFLFLLKNWKLHCFLICVPPTLILSFLCGSGDFQVLRLGTSQQPKLSETLLGCSKLWARDKGRLKSRDTRV